MSPPFKRCLPGAKSCVRIMPARHLHTKPRTLLFALCFPRASGARRETVWGQQTLHQIAGGQNPVRASSSCSSRSRRRCAKPNGRDDSEWTGSRVHSAPFRIPHHPATRSKFEARAARRSVQPRAPVTVVVALCEMQPQPVCQPCDRSIYSSASDGFGSGGAGREAVRPHVASAAALSGALHGPQSRAQRLVTMTFRSHPLACQRLTLILIRRRTITCYGRPWMERRSVWPSSLRGEQHAMMARHRTATRQRLTRYSCA